MQLSLTKQQVNLLLIVLSEEVANPKTDDEARRVANGLIFTLTHISRKDEAARKDGV